MISVQDLFLRQSNIKVLFEGDFLREDFEDNDDDEEEHLSLFARRGRLSS
jgi:hypothetical protein